MLQSLKARASEEMAEAPEAAVEILDCRNGTMLVFRSDEVIGRSLRLYGEWSEHELSYLRPYVQDGTVVIDVGANIGTHSLAFAKWVPAGSVIAVEPQIAVMSVLQVNCLLNGRENVEIVNAACANRQGEAIIQIFDPTNLGATGFKADTRIITGLHRLFNPLTRGAKPVIPLVRIDDIAANRPVSLIKIDAEGMEFEALDGAKTIIRTSRPAIFCEQNDTRQLSAIYDLLISFGYKMYWLETHQFNRANFRGEKNNVWWRTETGLLGIHETVDPPGDVLDVDRNATEIPSRYDASLGSYVA